MDEASFQTMAGMRVVYSLPGMEKVPVRKDRSPCYPTHRFSRLYEQDDFQVFLDREEQEKRRRGAAFSSFWSAGKQAAPYCDMTPLIGHHLGGYLLEEEIGRGALGIVYRGRQVALERDVAVKVFSHLLMPDPSFVIRFLREARILARIWTCFFSVAPQTRRHCSLEGDLTGFNAASDLVEVGQKRSDTPVAQSSSQYCR
ncbi:MAG TPA: hypothetical protein VFV38_17335 [Ktedonobacteraceae bacterium]|nr:hypothetical protein [Ktedonobacteraceae bacterium]